MLTTLQLLQQELSQQMADKPAAGKVSVIMPAPQWNMNADSTLDAYEAETLRSEDEEKVVFELEPYVAHEGEDVSEEIEEEEIYTQPTPAPVEKVEIPHREIYVSYLPAEKPVIETKLSIINPEPLPVTPPPSVQAVVMPNPAPETDQKLLNDLHEKPLPEVFSRFHEPIKDLKKAISINDRYQYINNLFSGDEATFDRSIKTINSFNVFSEAEYWIRRELSVKYGWEESAPLVQQFYALVSRRFS